MIGFKFTKFISSLYFIKKAFEDNVNNRTCHSIYEGSLDITFTVLTREIILNLFSTTILNFNVNIKLGHHYMFSYKKLIRFPTIKIKN